MTQHEAMAILASGQSALLTGAAGAGKTYVLNMFIEHARMRGKKVAVTATTGLAATHLNGTTIHAWSGMGIHDQLPKSFVQHLSKARREQLEKADILVIDEISMLHDYRLDMLDDLLRQVRRNPEPFGGVQVVLCGDFFQLPPVNRSDSRQGGFITNSQVWSDADFAVCYLSEQHRQVGGDEFTALLNNMRSGVITRRQLNLLQSRIGARLDGSVVPTRLHTTNVDVDSINARELEWLPGEVHEFEMTTTGRANFVEQLQRSCLAAQTLRLKRGALVMCIKNSQERRYVNGSLGRVMEFEKGTGYPVVELLNGRKITVGIETWELMDGDKRRAQLFQLPLRLAWAITVHKSQGMTLDAAHVDLSRAFVEGMGYVALSRVRAIDTLVLEGLNGMALRVSKEALMIESELQARSEAAVELYADLIAAYDSEKQARTTKKAKKPSTSWAEKIAKMRETYPNAYKPWKSDDDTILKQAHALGSTTEQLSQQMGRHPGSIKMRLEKLLDSE